MPAAPACGPCAGYGRRHLIPWAHCPLHFALCWASFARSSLLSCTHRQQEEWRKTERDLLWFLFPDEPYLLLRKHPATWLVSVAVLRAGGIGGAGPALGVWRPGSSLPQLDLNLTGPHFSYWQMVPCPSFLGTGFGGASHIFEPMSLLSSLSVAL